MYTFFKCNYTRLDQVSLIFKESFFGFEVVARYVIGFDLILPDFDRDSLFDFISFVRFITDLFSVFK